MFVEAIFLSPLQPSLNLGKSCSLAKTEKNSIPHLILIQHIGLLLVGNISSLTIIAVNDIDETMGALVKMASPFSDLVLAADLPHSEAQVSVFDGPNVEADSGDCGDHLP